MYFHPIQYNVDDGQDVGIPSHCLRDIRASAIFRKPGDHLEKKLYIFSRHSGIGTPVERPSIFTIHNSNKVQFFEKCYPVFGMLLKL